MSWTDIIIFFLSIFMSIESVVLINQRMEQATNHANNIYGTYVITACEDAMELLQTDAEELSEDGNKNKNTIWKEYDTREKAVNTFYSSLGLSLNKKGDYYYHDLEIMTPVICLVDYDGFYISYNAAFDDMSVSDEGYDKLHHITNLQTWAETVGRYTVRYYLNDNVQVITNYGVQYSGNRKEVYAQIAAKESYHTDLSYLIDDEEFDVTRNACVIQHIDEQIEYYINNLNNRADGYFTQYTLSLPENAGETWAGQIDNPTILAFIQGKTYNIRQKNVSVYSIGAYDVDESLHYFITGTGDDRYYHCFEEEVWKGNIQLHNENKYYKGQKIDRMYSSGKECAKQGAYPATE